MDQGWINSFEDRVVLKNPEASATVQVPIYFTSGFQETENKLNRTTQNDWRSCWVGQKNHHSWNTTTKNMLNAYSCTKKRIILLWEI